MQTQLLRRKAVAFGLALTRNTPLAPGLPEKQLLAAYIQGRLTLDEVVACLEEPSSSGGLA